MFVKQSAEIAPRVRVRIVQLQRAPVSRFRLQELPQPRMAECEIIKHFGLVSALLLPFACELDQFRPRSGIAQFPRRPRLVRAIHRWENHGPQ